MLDLVIRNGWIIDGSGQNRFQADVGVTGNQITAIGNLKGVKAKKNINACRLVVTPGFIDMHTHIDRTINVCPNANSLVHQGVTTAVIGQCGLGMAPLFNSNREEITAALNTHNIPIPWGNWSDYVSYLEFIETTGISLNIVPVVAQGTIRAGVMGFGSEQASSTQLATMQNEVIKAMEAGAFGLSSGLVYPPGSYTSTKELIAVTKPVGERDGYYFSHIRGQDGRLLAAVAEAIEIGRNSGASVQISHLLASWPVNWEKHGQALELLDQARDQGLDICADVFPYQTGHTNLKATLPAWSQQGGKNALMERLADGQIRKQMSEDMITNGFLKDADWNRVRISRSVMRPEYSGYIVTELAASAQKDPTEWVFDALLENELGMTIITYGFSENNIIAALKHPAFMIGSDSTFAIPDHGELALGMPHPRVFGTFPRVLGPYVRDKKVMTLEEAIYKMTGQPAVWLQIKDRGLIKQGFAADLVVFNPESISDQSTLDKPFRYPIGISHVICNGTSVIAKGCHTGSLPGKILKHM